MSDNLRASISTWLTLALSIDSSGPTEFDLLALRDWIDNGTQGDMPEPTNKGSVMSLDQEETLTFEEYQEATEATAVYPEAGWGTPMALAYVGLGLGESGEVQGKIKKIIRDDQGEVSNEVRAAIAKELGDQLWYIGRVAAELGLSLGAIATNNLAKLSDRKDRGVLGGSGDDR